MAKLTFGKRKKMSKKEFAIPKKAPGSGSYPIDTENRGRNALARVSQFGTPEEKAMVRAKVAKKFPNIKQRKFKIKKKGM